MLSNCSGSHCHFGNKNFLSDIWKPLPPLDRFSLATMSDELKVMKKSELAATQVLILVNWNYISRLKAP